MPSEVIYRNSDMVVTTKFTTIAGFLLMTSQKTEEGGSVRLYEYTYNEKGHLIGEKTSSGSEYRYSYEYDSNGNWINMVYEYKDGAVWKTNDNSSKIREYTYW